MNRTGCGRPDPEAVVRDDADAGSGAARIGWHANQRRRVVGRWREPLPTRVRDTAPLPPGYETALRLGCDQLGISLTPVARAAIDGHARLLLAWTNAINLTAIRDPAALATLHVVDSLSALAVVRERGADRLLDLGSGGGYPGLPLAATLPMDRSVLVEPVAKKARFLTTAVDAAGLAASVEVAPVRAELLAADPGHRGRWPLITARAVASLPELIELALPLLGRDGCLIAWKRGDIATELAAGERALTALGGGFIEVRAVPAAGLDGHVLVVVTSAGRVPPGFPRDRGMRKRWPW